MKKIGLLIVDAQVGFNPCQKLLDSIQNKAKNYSFVAMTRFFNAPESLYRTVLNWRGEGGELAISLPGAIILDKTGYGLTPQHIKILKAHCNEWHVCGFETDACVLACSFSLWDSGLLPTILYDLCDSPLQDEAIAIGRRQFG